MPFLPSPVMLAASIVERSAAAATSTAPQAVPTVVCVFPVSGQYGPGSRILYYALVAACIFGQNFVLLRTACLAGALLIPAVAALHAIVLASVHVDGVVDMDIYGALQICAVGVLAGPITVKMSGTYFNDPGRNLIFLWTTLVLAGLLSLVVEFFRANPVPCTTNDFQYEPDGNPDGMCNLHCTTDFPSPMSPLRTTTQNNIYIIQNPTDFSFSAAVLVSAACCVPAVLSLASMLNKILEINFKKSFRRNSDDGAGDAGERAQKDAPTGKVARFWWRVKSNLTKVEIPIFGLACLTIVIVGELNFWSPGVFFETEAISSVGQWAPIVATILAITGSLYTRFASGGDDDASASGQREDHHSHHRGSYDDAANPASGVPEMHEKSEIEDMDTYPNGSLLSPQDTHRSGKMASLSTSPTFPQSPHDLRHVNSNSSDGAALDRAFSVATTERGDGGRRTSKRGLAQTLKEKMEADFDDTGFRKGPATNYPLVPGEIARNRYLLKTHEMWGSEQTGESSLRRQKSRSGSFVSERSVNSNDASEPSSPRVEEVAGSSSPPMEHSTTRRSTLQTPRPSLLMPPPRRSTVSASTPPPLAIPSPTIQISRPEDMDDDEDAIVESDSPVDNDTEEKT